MPSGPFARPASAMDRHACAIRGFQVAFLAFALVLLNAPADKYVFSQWQWARDLELPVGRMMMFVTAAVLILLIDPLRRHCAMLLSARVATGTRREVVIGIGLVLLIDFAAFGGFALWNWLVGGEPRLARVMGQQQAHADEMSRALSTYGIVYFALFATTLGPIIEELLFRGMLYPAWRDAWGWVFGSLATAAVFGAFHGTFWPQFLGSLVFVCVLRKTNSLRGAIYVHAAGNLLLWYPVMGQFMLPGGLSTGELHLWTFHLVCLAGVLVLLPWYMWTARDARLPTR